MSSRKLSECGVPSVTVGVGVFSSGAFLRLRERTVRLTREARVKPLKSATR